MPLSTVISKSALGKAFRRLSTLKKKSLAFKKKKSFYFYHVHLSGSKLGVGMLWIISM